MTRSSVPECGMTVRHFLEAIAKHNIAFDEYKKLFDEAQLPGGHALAPLLINVARALVDDMQKMSDFAQTRPEFLTADKVSLAGNLKSLQAIVGRLRS